MLFKNNMGSKSRKEKNIALILSAFLIAFVLAGLYLSFAWDRYQEMFETEAIKLAESLEALLPMRHISDLAEDGPMSI